MAQALWNMNARAVKWFNYRYSLPKVWLSSLQMFAGLVNVGNADKPLVMTCSISEDYARLWLYFAQKSLGKEQWDFLIVDSAGDMDASKFEGCRLFRFLNVYHGKKVDMLLQKFIKSKFVFLCDDDKYILGDVSKHFSYLQDPNTPVVSLSPRTWWKFKIDGEEFFPMGSYALMFNRQFFLERQLKFQSPAGLKSDLKVFTPGIKQQQSYDTADYVNEQLLLSGYQVVTLPHESSICGFDGLSGRRILLMKYPKEDVKQALLETQHYHIGSSNGGTIRSLYGIVKSEQLYRDIFQTEPKFRSGFSEGELRTIVEKNMHITASQKEEVLSYFKRLERTYQRLLGSL